MQHCTRKFKEKFIILRRLSFRSSQQSSALILSCASFFIQLASTYKQTTRDTGYKSFFL